MKYNIKLVIAYDGSEFYGWQSTKMGPSIESCLKEVLETILQEKISLQAASRTDRFVNAEGQVINFFTHKTIPCLEALVKSCNALLPDAIRILKAKQMSPSFHPTLDALSKEYHYYIQNNSIALPKFRLTCWHVYLPLKINKMREGAKHLIGTHDFSSFCNRKKNPATNNIRTLISLQIVSLSEKRIRIEMRGTAFLYRMARNLAGTLVGVGLGMFHPDEIGVILKAKKRPLAGITAPPHGLFLNKIYY